MCLVQDVEFCVYHLMPSHDMMHNLSAERYPDDTLSVPYRVLTNLTDFTGVGSHILPNAPVFVMEKHI